MKLPHKSNINRKSYTLKGYKALIITTSHSSLDKIDGITGKVIKVGKATGVYASEMTEPYYTFLDAQMEVEIASITGGKHKVFGDGTPAFLLHFLLTKS